MKEYRQPLKRTASLVSELQVQSVEGSGLQDGAKWSDPELLPDIRRGVFIPLIEARLTRTTSARGWERRDSEKRIKAETRTGEGQGQVHGLGGQMGLMAGASFLDDSERSWGAGGGEPQGRTKGLPERLGAGRG